jgi:hypothetical protein
MVVDIDANEDSQVVAENLRLQTAYGIKEASATAYHQLGGAWLALSVDGSAFSMSRSLLSRSVLCFSFN